MKNKLSRSYREIPASAGLNLRPSSVAIEPRQVPRMCNRARKAREHCTSPFVTLKCKQHACVSFLSFLFFFCLFVVKTSLNIPLFLSVLSATFKTTGRMFPETFLDFFNASVALKVSSQTFARRLRIKT